MCQIDRENEPDTSGAKKWEELLARPESQELLLQLAREAPVEHKAGKTTEIIITKDGPVPG